MTITILPSLGIFNLKHLFDNTRYTTIMHGNLLFKETFVVDLLPGIYIYNFRESDKKKIYFKYNGDSVHSTVLFGATKKVDFEPYTLYYIKQ